MKKIIIVTGGAGFVGSNLISYLLDKSTYKIISLDNYSSGTNNNHVKHKRIKYLKGDTRNIKKFLLNIKKIFTHFFILANLLGYFKALRILINVLVPTLLDQRSFQVLFG